MSHAVVLTGFGGPEVLQWREVETPSAGPGEILVRVKAAGVGPTDLTIRAGHLANVFPQGPGSVLGFEAAGVVEQFGADLDGVAVGDEVAVYLPDQGGYGELVAASVWHAKPAEVSWQEAAALPASAEAALGVLRQVRAAEGDTLVVLGAAGSVGVIAVQLARAWGVRVVGAASSRDEELITSFGAEFVPYGEGVFDRVSAVTERVDAVVDVAGHGGLPEAVRATGDPSRVVTLADHAGAAATGATMSNPSPDRAPDALAVTLPMLADGSLRLKRNRSVPFADAAEAHRLLESGETRDKIVLV
ncbi:NADP-dependent oxidoreductase [Leifsonia naganoensis]|uniref:NADPH:quinone reductase-like Zn-dependent oxidoreductase n=1 Tax=Leifsonia naganoensis TaxID=150025 RepID=A0A853DXW8_9MICO|nr:NADP-dependent oxidoreductase [Leifsonia naganoensis]NYK11771.1 NADPH:quinone reductase-like Zn-dependent oxidoreductase [Leifsonia naganoensis]